MASSHLEKTRINNRLPIAREGLPFIVAGCILTALFYVLGLTPVTILFALLTLFTIWFFRDPERESHADEKAVLTPADGRCLGSQVLENTDNPLGEPALLISIFMNVFNVHVNRIPATGNISEITYHKGKFFSADLDKASKENENNRILLQTDTGHKIAFVQIAGLIARRIACWIQEGDRVNAGQRFGLIRFGSRLDVYLPKDSRLSITAGTKVKAGVTILGYLP
ncbi:phosphatidylserine decarboxylase family protein [Thermodesulfobacteriota bacterium]